MLRESAPVVLKTMHPRSAIEQEIRIRSAWRSGNLQSHRWFQAESRRARKMSAAQEFT
jgi:hypothetical protein